MKKLILISAILFCFVEVAEAWDQGGWGKQKISYIKKTAAPAVTDDDFGIPYLWVDETNDKIYFLLDNTPGAADWDEVVFSGAAISGTLLTDGAGDADIGTEALYWQKLFLKSSISFEGATDDAFQLTLTVTDPTTSDKTITFPDETGTVLTTASLASALTSVGTITSLVATTADINAGTFDGTVGGTTPAAGTFTTLTATGTLHGKIEIVDDDNSLSAAQCSGSLNKLTGAESTILPAAVAGMNVLLYSIDATVKTIAPNGNDHIWLNGVDNGATNSINSPGAVGDYIVFVAFTDNNWHTIGQSGTWIDTP